jgi:hypothetical protein
MGRAPNPTNWVANDASTPEYADPPGKNSFGKTSAAAVPYRKKSYHSTVVPTVLAITARRRWRLASSGAVARAPAMVASQVRCAIGSPATNTVRAVPNCVNNRRERAR